MARGGHTKAQIEGFREQIFALWCDGQTWVQIASAVGLSARQCQTHLQQRQASIRVRDESVDRSLAEREKAIGFYEAQKRRALDQFAKSTQERKRRKDKLKQRPGKQGGDPVELAESEESTEDRIGLAQLLRVANDAQREIDALNQLPKGARSTELPAGLVNVVFYIPENDRDQRTSDKPA